MVTLTRVAPLVDAAWLVDALDAVDAVDAVDDPDVVLLEVDEDAAAYYQGHLPGAQVLDWQDDLHDPVRRRFLSQERFEALMDAKDITRDTHVVLYGDGDNVFAAHAYWIFRYYRHPRVSLLDGGRRAWQAAGGALVQECPVRPRGQGYASPGPDPAIRITREELLWSCVGAPPGVRLLDCRTPEEYAGHPGHAVDLPVERHRVVGHIPGARNLPAETLLDKSGAFRPEEELRRIGAEHGISPEVDVVVYCRVAGQSSLTWFALHELLEHPSVRNYDGGWAEYGSLVDVPVQRD